MKKTIFATVLIVISVMLFAKELFATQESPPLDLELTIPDTSKFPEGPIYVIVKVTTQEISSPEFEIKDVKIYIRSDWGASIAKPTEFAISELNPGVPVNISFEVTPAFGQSEIAVEAVFYYYGQKLRVDRVLYLMSNNRELLYNMDSWSHLMMEKIKNDLRLGKINEEEYKKRYQRIITGSVCQDPNKVIDRCTGRCLEDEYPDFFGKKY